MHISDAPLSPRKEDFGGGRDGTCRRDAERMPGRGGSAKLKIKWCDLHYKSITLWHLHKVYLCNSTSFSSSSSLPSSGPPSRRSAAWARINMYKSLFGGKIELQNRQKVWRVHFAGVSAGHLRSTHNAPGEGRVSQIGCFSSDDVSPERKRDLKVTQTLINAADLCRSDHWWGEKGAF